MEVPPDGTAETEDPGCGTGELEETPETGPGAGAGLPLGEANGLLEGDAGGTTTAEEEEAPGGDPRLPVDVPMEVWPPPLLAGALETTEGCDDGDDWGADDGEGGGFDDCAVG